MSKKSDLTGFVYFVLPADENGKPDVTKGYKATVLEAADTYSDDMWTVKKPGSLGDEKGEDLRKIRGF